MIQEELLISFKYFRLVVPVLVASQHAAFSTSQNVRVAVTPILWYVLKYMINLRFDSTFTFYCMNIIFYDPTESNGSEHMYLVY